ncbi:MAG: hypothetical protein GC165_05100 [Armatimonadetes bacterium]|nr:hypothetical protein [Armatimonadota bacterium]
MSKHLATNLLALLLGSGFMIFCGVKGILTKRTVYFYAEAETGGRAVVAGFILTAFGTSILGFGLYALTH